MPYSSNQELPPRVRNNVPSERGQSIFRNTFNSVLGRGKTETVAFASAWAALQDAGFEQGSDGKWVKKTSPTASSVHVPSTGRRKRPFEKENDTSPGYKARNAVNNALRDGKIEKPAVCQGRGCTYKGELHAHHKNYNEPLDVQWLCRSCHQKTHGRGVGKRQLNDDVFTLEIEAQARSVELGLGGAVHVHETADGQATYMPGSSHEEYLEAMGQEPDDYEEQQEESMLEQTIRAIVSTVMGKSASGETVTKDGYAISSTVLKLDEDQRVVWGWASVISEDGEPVFDSQGDAISPEVLTKAANEFMESVRVAKAMHEGNQVGEVIHSLPLTKELGDALGVESRREGWIVAFKIHDDETWAKVKSGEFRSFSIGGEAIRNAV